jgi:predicted 2-oxoglutarate/Fe(II)-dependent dioxygenase YbiX
MKSIESYIMVINNAVPAELCDQILAAYKDGAWEKPKMLYGDSNDRKCDVMGMSGKHIANSPEKQKLDHDVFQCAGKVLNAYQEKHGSCYVKDDSGYDLLRYKTGDYILNHVDNASGGQRMLSCSFLLNDEFEGGEFAFFDKEIKYNLIKGDAILFPSNFMYPHEVMPILSGTRYSIITWFQ